MPARKISQQVNEVKPCTPIGSPIGPSYDSVSPLIVTTPSGQGRRTGEFCRKPSHGVKPVGPIWNLIG